MRSIAGLSLVLLLACGGGGSPKSDQVVPGPEGDEEGVATPVESEESEEPGNTEPGDAPNDKTCVDECVASRQMQATSIEQIELDCQKQCSESDL